MSSKLPTALNAIPCLGAASKRHVGQTSGKNPKGAELSKDRVPNRLALIQNTLTHLKPRDWKHEFFSLSC